MERPRVLLVPEFTELEWVIRPRLAEWAEVATYDPPGVGDQPLADEEVEAVRRGERRLGELYLRRGLEELDRLGWSRFFLAADGWSNAIAARIALARPGAVQGLALGHACLSFDMDGDRAPINREVWAAMRQLLRHDHREFVRHGIVQMTRGSVDDELAKRMLERFPDAEFLQVAWEETVREHEPIGEMLARLDRPLLLAQHEGCLGFTDEGFEDAAAAFPDARLLRVPEAPAVSATFAAAVREFCEDVEAGEGTRIEARDGSSRAPNEPSTSDMPAG